MNKNKLQISRELLDRFAKERFVQMAGSDQMWDEIYEKVSSSLKPQCLYIIYDDISVESNKLNIGGETLVSDFFAEIPKEIIGDAAAYVMTIGDIAKADAGVLDGTMIDIIGTAYVDALKNLLRMELQEDYILSGTVAPGIGKMAVEEIAKFDKLLDFSQIGIALNESYTMIPEKSATGLYMFFNEERPANTNSCETCMARGYGCNLCAVGGEGNV